MLTICLDKLAEEREEGSSSDWSREDLHDAGKDQTQSN